MAMYTVQVCISPYKQTTHTQTHTCMHVRTHAHTHTQVMHVHVHIHAFTVHSLHAYMYLCCLLCWTAQDLHCSLAGIVDCHLTDTRCVAMQQKYSFDVM